MLPWDGPWWGRFAVCFADGSVKRATVAMICGLLCGSFRKICRGEDNLRIPSGASSPLFECDIERRTTPRLFRDVRVRYKTVFFLIMVGLLCGDAVIDHTAENYGRLLTQMYGNRPYLP